MTTFRRLPGLPAYGPEAIAFPPELGKLGQEGLVVEFRTADKTCWVGNFGTGSSRFNDVRYHPNGDDVLVMSGGALWKVSPGAACAEEIESAAIIDVWQLDESGDLIFNDLGLTFFRLGPSGVVWRTRRISWDGFRGVHFEPEVMIGEAWSPIEGSWVPFAVDLKTGRADGGSYSEPE